MAIFLIFFLRAPPRTTLRNLFRMNQLRGLNNFIARHGLETIATKPTGSVTKAEYMSASRTVGARRAWLTLSIADRRLSSGQVYKNQPLSHILGVHYQSEEERIGVPRRFSNLGTASYQHPEVSSKHKEKTYVNVIRIAARSPTQTSKRCCEGHECVSQTIRAE